jgi:MFS family permease
MFGSYLTLFRIKGALRFSIAGFIGRMPISMESLSLIFFIVAKTHSYAIAGALTALGSVVFAISSPLWSRYADRFGQRRVLFAVAPIRATLLISLIFVVNHNLPKWTWFLLVFFAEIPAVTTGSMVRRRWIYILERQQIDHSANPLGARDLINTAYSYEAFIDEMVFIFGPIIATACATLITPSAGLIAAILFLVLGLPLLAIQKDSEPPAMPKNHEDPHPSVIRNQTVLAVVLPATFLGGFFGAVGITVVGFAQFNHLASRTGLLLAIWALGSATSAVVNGIIKWRTTYAQRFLISIFVLTLFSIPFIFSQSFGMMAFALYINGLAVSPLIVNAFGVAETAVPPAQITESLAWVIAGMPLGGAISSALAGWVIDNYGVKNGLFIPTGFLVGSLLSLIPFTNIWRKLLKPIH